MADPDRRQAAEHDGGPTTAVSQLLHRWKAGDGEALGLLVPLVYQELRQRARQRLGGWRADGLPSTTSLVHDTFIKLARSGMVRPEDRHHFLAVASLAMRQILVDRARQRLAAREESVPGPGQAWEPADERILRDEGNAAELLALHQALDQLKSLDERSSSVVELHFFGGLTFEEVAEVLSLSERTVMREWRKARCFLHRQLGPGPAPGAAPPPS